MLKEPNVNCFRFNKKTRRWD
jgi:hypothetical protein